MVCGENMMEIIRIPAEVAGQLKCDVHALRDPRTRELFYMGKGIGSRINAHATEAQNNPTSERAKVRRIIEIEAEGLEIDFHGDTVRGDHGRFGSARVM